MGWFGNNLAGRLAFLHREMEVLADHIGYSLLDDDRFSGVVDNVRSGKDILAAKTYRDVTGSSVGEAAAAVEEIQRLLRGRGWSQISVD